MKRRSTYWISAVIVGISIAGLCLINVGRTDAVNQTAASALGQTSSEAEIGTLGGFDDSALPAIGKMVAALVVVIFAIYAGVWLLRRFTGGRRGRSDQRLLEVLETAYLGSKKSVALLRVADKSVLVGVTETQMSVLTELDADQTAVALAGPDKTATGDDFDRLYDSAAKQLQRFSGRVRSVTQVS